MFDYDEYINKILSNFCLDNGRLEREVFERFLNNDIVINVEKKYDKLKELSNEKTISFEYPDEKATVTIKKYIGLVESNVIIYDVGQCGDMVRIKYELCNRNLGDNSFRAIYFDHNGSVYYSEIEYDENKSKYTLTIHFYNSETVEFFSDNKEDMSIYYELKSISIWADNVDYTQDYKTFLDALSAFEEKIKNESALKLNS